MKPITRALLTNKLTRPALRGNGAYLLRAVKGIVVHWTANEAPGANAMANRSYFNQGFRAASAHYIVDDNAIVQCVPENEVSFNCGDMPEGKYRPAGQAMRKGTNLTPNYFTISVEMCVNKGADWKATYQTTVDLVARLLLKHRLVIQQLYRHFDITGKACPKPFLQQPEWQAFCMNVAATAGLLHAGGVSRATVDAKELNVRSGPGAGNTLLWALTQGEPVLIEEERHGWARIGEGQWVNKRYLAVK